MSFNKKRQFDSDSDGESSQVVKKSRPSKPAAKEVARITDEAGNSYWDIGKNRRVSSSVFKGQCLINIREFYLAPDGTIKPGKKGISLSMDQYNALLKVIPQLNQDLRAEGHDVGADPPAAANTSAKAPKSKESKANIDATSDEEEDGVED